MSAFQSENRDTRLVVVSSDPFNAETPLDQHRGVLTPNELFYVRNHFPVPKVDGTTWRLFIDGEVDQPISLGLDEIREFPAVSITATLECAGNGRSGMTPQPPGEPWNYGAVSTAEWTGVRLATVLNQVRPRQSAVELLIEGLDGGIVDGASEPITYVRSMPMSDALSEDALIAYAMNGEPLPPDHGFPVRLIVPGWYGMASVKWLKRLHLSHQQFAGFYQRDRYVFDAGGAIRPLNWMEPRSLIVEPVPSQTLRIGPQHVRGVAWSGRGPITQVEFRAGSSHPWEPATLLGDSHQYAWREWEATWPARASGEYQLSSRAIDAKGRIQPLSGEWNRLGYVNNGVQNI